MPRQSRIDTPGALHHIICRGIERREIFSDDYDRDDFVSRLGGILVDTSTRCFAWALIPNHFHLLLQTGTTPIATVMRRLLTGYAVTFNRRHSRHGHLFQNRYKSILCQEEPYLLELVRYIHLNPIRSGVVTSMKGLEHDRYCGHSQILGHNRQSWMAADEILHRFGKRLTAARKAYLAFASEGVEQGKRIDLTGGGLVRSSGGWQQIKSAKQAGVFLKSDERILGDSNFVDVVLDAVGDALESRDIYRRQGIDLETVVRIVANLLVMEAGEVQMGGKQPRRVQARSLLCFWAVRELGLTATLLASTLNLSQPAVSIAVQRGERLARENGWRLDSLIGRNL
jgi:REP element-mobilizing transposase RayT